jgi:pyruvate formate lyase activating enzyme
MIIGGLQKFSLLDYPGHLAAIIFTQGCNFRCHFCYNPMLVRPPDDLSYASASTDTKDGAEAKDHRLSLSDLFVFLAARAGKLEGVVITGGEPTIHPDLPDFIRQIRELGFKIKLDTNGTNPEMLAGLISEKLVDYIAMDIKGSPKRYSEVAGVEVNLEKVKKSVKIIMKSGLAYEFRTTLVPGLVDKQDLKAMGELVKGAKKWYLQQFKSDIDLVDNDFRGAVGFKASELKEFAQTAATYVISSELR